MRRHVFGLMLFSSAIVLLGAGCAVSPDASPGTSGNPSYVGTWQRQALFVDGAPTDAVPATIVFQKDRYTSTTSCTAQGRVTESDGSLTMTLDSTDCPVGAIPDVYTSSYAISDGGNAMTLTNTEFGAEVREEYARQ